MPIKQHLPLLDQQSGSMVQVTRAHERTHSGEFFAIMTIASGVNSGETKRWLISTPITKSVRFSFTIAADAKSQIRFYEEPVVTVSGTSLNPYCTNRVIDTAPDVLVFEDTTITSPGPLMLSVDTIGSAGGAAHAAVGGHSDMSISEWILKPNTNYLIEATANGDTANFALRASYYEID